MKADQHFVLCIVLFITGILFGATFFTGYLELQPETFFPALATLIAAFVGAWAAFLLQEHKEKRAERERHVGHGNEVIAALADHANQLYVFRKQFIEPHRDDKANWLRIMPLPYDLKPNIELDVLNLSFLWQIGEANLTNKVSNEKHKFILLLEIINKRSKVHSNAVQPVFESLGFIQGDKIPAKLVHDSLGPRTVAIMIGLTDDMIEGVDTVIKSHLDIAKELHKEIKKLYPNKKVLKIEGLNE